MATHNIRARTAAVIILLIVGILVIAASAVTWPAYETNSARMVDPARIPEVVIYVDASSSLQYFPNFTTRPVNTAYLPSKLTTIPTRILTPTSSTPSGSTISIPSSGTQVTPVNSYSTGFTLKAPFRQNTTTAQKFPYIASKPSILKPVPTIKTVTPVLPVPTLLPVTLVTPVPSNVIVNSSTHQVEQRIFYYTNIERANVGKPALNWDDQLATIGRDDCVDMATQGFFDHINPDGETPADRAVRHGYQVEKDFGTYIREGVGENIVMLSNYSGTPDEIARFIVDAWMNSPEHRANIVDSEDQKFTVIGVGVAYDQTTDTWYAAQEFF